jgi:hypothetical protein
MTYTSTPVRFNKSLDGKSQYLHIKYSDDGETFTANNGEELGAWIGTLVDFNEADSTTFGDYTWKKFTEDVDEELNNIRQTIFEQSTAVLNTAESIIMSALESYVQTSNYEEFRQTVDAQVRLLKDEFSIKFEETETKINNVDGDLQSKFNQIATIFEFNINGFSIGKTGSPYKIFMDDNEFSMLLNGVQVLWFELSENSNEANIPELNITKKLNLFGFLIDQDEYGNVNCEYVGG